MKREEKKKTSICARTVKVSLWSHFVHSLTLTHTISICWNIFHMCVKLVFAFPFYFNSFIACCDFRFFVVVFLEFFEGFAFCIQIQFTSVGEFMRYCEKERWYYNWRRKNVCFKSGRHLVVCSLHKLTCTFAANICTLTWFVVKRRRKKHAERNAQENAKQEERKRNETNTSSRIEGNITVNVQSAIGLHASGFMRKINATECGSANIQYNRLHEAFVTSCFFSFSFIRFTHHFLFCIVSDLPRAIFISSTSYNQLQQKPHNK